MEPNKPTPPVAETPKPAATPVMDVVTAPPLPASDKPADAPKPELSKDERQNDQDDKGNDKNKSKPDVKTVKTAKQPSNGVGAAIFATVVIVLVLAGLATYAYIKTR